MPEGDTIFRSATSLRRWLEGREVTAARSTVLGAHLQVVVGARIDAVEARAKHLLIRFSSGQVLHTHMRMTGSWHVYRAGTRWRRPAWQARVVLEAGDRLAVCFNAPVVELLAAHEERLHPSLASLGPDVLVEPLDLGEVRRRAATRPADLPIGELLLDQRVVSGIGNIYRCESLFLRRVHPWTPLSSVGDDDLDALVTAAADLMAANARPGSSVGRDLGAGPDRAYVYGRRGRPCRRCGAAVSSARLGDQGRLAYWCPRCQPATSGKQVRD